MKSNGSDFSNVVNYEVSLFNIFDISLITLVPGLVLVLVRLALTLSVVLSVS